MVEAFKGLQLAVAYLRGPAGPMFLTKEEHTGRKNDCNNGYAYN